MPCSALDRACDRAGASWLGERQPRKLKWTSRPESCALEISDKFNKLTTSCLPRCGASKSEV